MHVRQVKQNWRWLALATTIAVVLAAPIAVNLFTELRLSPDTLSRGINTDTLTVDSFWDVFVRPFGPPSDDWIQMTLGRGARVLFFGGPAAVLTIFYLVVVRIRVDLYLGWLAPLLVLTPGVLVTDYVSATWQFRDPLILFAVPCAVLALDWIARRSALGCWVATVVATGQLVVLAAGVWPFIALNLEARQAPATEVFVGERPISSWLRDHVAPTGGRVYYSAGVDRLLWDQELTHDGLWRNSMFYRDVPVVTASFKFISIEPISPGGAILGLPEVTSGDLTLLDLVGVRWVLARADETVSSGLVKRSERTSSRGVRLFLYEYPPARGAVFIDSSVRTTTLPAIPGCVHARLLCLDFSQLAPLMSKVTTRVNRERGRIKITFGPSDQQRLLLVGEMFRPGWRVAEVDAVVEPLLGALIGVKVPPGARQVTLRFIPLFRFILTIASWATMLLVTALFAVSLARRNLVACR